MPRIKWPPKIARIDELGEVKDVNGRHIPRDVGMPGYIGGNTYYIFGDTFCFDDSKEFVGGTNNTIAYVPDYQNDPAECQYLQQEPKVREFIPHTPSETAFEEIPENKKAIKRVTNWNFGGIIEDSDGSGTGWAFFHKVKDMEVIGVSVCKVHIHDGNRITAERVMGDEMLFKSSEPSFGAITYLIEDGWVYLMGGKDVNPPFDMRAHWARIRRDADFTKRSNYQFLLASGDWGDWSNERQDDLHRIDWLETQGQGDVIYCPEMAPEGRPYMWFGVNKFAASHLYVACSAHLHKDWDVQDVGEIPAYFKPGSPRYALFPHPRVSRTDHGQMLVSWSDAWQMGGMVVQAVYNFETEGDEPPLPPLVPVKRTRPSKFESSQQQPESAPYSQHQEHTKHGSVSELIKGKLGGLFK